MSTLTTYDMEQRSPEWYAVRCGMVTASTIGALITLAPPGADAYVCNDCQAPAWEPCIGVRNGQPLKRMHPVRYATAEANAATAEPVFKIADDDTAKGMLTTLAAERLTGNVEESSTTLDMWRGIEHEPFAKDYYEEHYAAVNPVGFMVRDFGGYKIGCSPDGLVGDDGMVEVKCPRAKTHIATVLDDEVPKQHMAQLQTALLVSGREWIDYISFHGGLPLYVKRVTPNPKWFDAIHAAAAHAERAISAVIDDFTAATQGLPATERPDLEIKVA